MMVEKLVHTKGRFLKNMRRTGKENFYFISLYIGTIYIYTNMAYCRGPHLCTNKKPEPQFLVISWGQNLRSLVSSGFHLASIVINQNQPEPEFLNISLRLKR
jgi:hypothetical protein